MDDIQRTICDAFKKNPDIISDRQRLKSALADIIPNEKLMQNIILDAYDEDVVSKFTAKNSEIAMQALKLSRDLVDGYGLTDDSATWSVSTWCYALGYNEVAELIAHRTSNTVTVTKQKVVSNNLQYRTEYSFDSVYKAGVDFPAGSIQIICSGKIKKGYFSIHIYKKPNMKSEASYMSGIVEQAYLDVLEGQYLFVKNVCIQPDPDFGYQIIEVDK